MKGTYIIRCSYHLAHRAASKGGTAFSKVIGHDMEKDQVNTYEKFKGTTRQNIWSL